MNTKINRQT